MAVLKPRERLVYFRISEDEFHQFASLCEREGARSVSDLARCAVQRLIAESDQRQENQRLAPKMELLEKLIGEVNAQLEFLATMNHGDPTLARNGKADSHSSAANSADHLQKEQPYGSPA